MSKADTINTISDRLPLSRLFRDPVLRAAFARAERDNGAQFAVPVTRPRRPLAGGAVVEPALAA